MDSPKNGARGAALKYGPAVRIGIAVLVLHTIGWLGWKMVNQDAESKKAKVTVTAKHEQLLAALAEK